MKYIIKIMLISISIISFFICLYNYDTIPVGYKIMIYLPLIFIVGYVFLDITVISQKRYLITTYSLIILSFIRMTLIPLFASLANEYREVEYGTFVDESISKAISLITYEFIVCCLLIFFLTKIFKGGYFKFNSEINNRLVGNKLIYISFLILGVIVFLLFGYKMNLIQFIAINSNTGERFGDASGTFYVLITQIIKISVVIIFLLAVSYCSKKYYVNKKNRYFNIAIVVSLINVSLIIGERRMTVIYTGIASICVLIYAFPKKAKKILIIIGTTMFFIILLMTIYKSFYAFMYESYFSAIQNSSLELSFIPQTLQAYFWGPHNISMMIDMKEIYSGDIGNILFDFFRSTFGFNFMLKNSGILTSITFNSFVYGTYTETGRLISSIAYGYYYLGFVFSPLFSGINIYLSMLIENRFYKSKNFEEIFLWSYVLARIAISLLFNTPAIINVITTLLGTMGLVFWVSKILKLKNIRLNN